jgi:hypothetical protein
MDFRKISCDNWSWTWMKMTLDQFQLNVLLLVLSNLLFFFYFGAVYFLTGGHGGKITVWESKTQPFTLLQTLIQEQEINPMVEIPV